MSPISSKLLSTDIATIRGRHRCFTKEQASHILDGFIRVARGHLDLEAFLDKARKLKAKDLTSMKNTGVVGLYVIGNSGGDCQRAQWAVRDFLAGDPDMPYTPQAIWAEMVGTSFPDDKQSKERWERVLSGCVAGKGIKKHVTGTTVTYQWQKTLAELRAESEQVETVTHTHPPGQQRRYPVSLHGINDAVYCICDDGTLWVLDGGWHQLPEVPQS